MAITTPSGHPIYPKLYRLALQRQQQYPLPGVKNAQRKHAVYWLTVLALIVYAVGVSTGATKTARGQEKKEEIRLVKTGGVYTLPVTVNELLTLHFILDSGAADVQIPADIVGTLYRTGTIQETDFLPGATYVLADGSTVRSARFLLRSLTIGRQRIIDVPASIGSLTSPPLLGQSLLKRLGTWSVDNEREVLIMPSLASPRGATRPTLVVSPLRLSSQVAQVGQRLTVELEAINTSKRPG